MHTQISEKEKMSSTVSTSTTSTSTSTEASHSATRLMSSDVSEIVSILEGGKAQVKSTENENKSSQLAPTSAPASIISLSSSSTTTAAATTTTDKDKKLLIFSFDSESVADLSKPTVQSKLSLSNKRKWNMVHCNKSFVDSDAETTKTNDEDGNNKKKKKGKALLGDISTSKNKEQLKGSTSSSKSKKKHQLHNNSKYKINPIKSTSKSTGKGKSSIISHTKKKSQLRKAGRPKTKVVVNGDDVLTSNSTASNEVQDQVESQVSGQVVNVQEVPSSTKKEKVSANVIRSGLKRSCKDRSNKSYLELDIDVSPQAIGPIPTITLNEDDNDNPDDNLEVPLHSHQDQDSNVVEVGEKEDFNPCHEDVYENALYGHSKISCLPREPKKPEDRAKSNLSMINLLLGERQREEEQFKLWSRAHLDVQRSILNQFNHTLTSDDISRFNYLTNYANGPKLKLRDLNDVDSYEIIARRIDEDGITRHLVKWKDGSESDSDEQDNELMEVDEPEVVIVKVVEKTEAQKITIPGSTTDLEESLRSVVSNETLSTCGENAAVSFQVPSTSTTNNISKDTSTTMTTINLNNVNQEVDSVSSSSSSSNGALPPTTTITTSTAAEVLGEIAEKDIISVQKAATKDIKPTLAIAIEIEKRDDNESNSDVEPKRPGKEYVPYVDLTKDSP